MSSIQCFQNKIMKLLFTFLFCLISFQIESFGSDEPDLMGLSIEELMKVEVNSAGKKNERIRNIPASVMAISREEIEAYGFSSLRDILNNIPGMYAMSNLGIDVYGIRGYTKGKGTNFIITINGVEITDERILTFYQIPVDSIDKVEVVRGPMAMYYGNNAFFGVINIVTDSEYENRYSVMTGTFGTKEFFGRMSMSFGQLKTTLNVSYFDSDGMDEPLDRMISRPERMDEPLFGGEEGMGLSLPEEARTTDGYLGRDQLSINFSAIMDKFSFKFNYVDAENFWYYYFPSLDGGCLFRNKNATFSFEYQDEISSTLNYLAKFRYSQTEGSHVYRHLFEGFYGTDSFNIDEAEFEFNTFWNPTENIDVTLGLQYQNMLTYENFTQVPPANILGNEAYYIDENDNGEVFSLFAEADLTFNENNMLIAGVRMEKAKGYNMRFETYRGLTPPTPDYEKTTYGTIPDADMEFMPKLAYIYHIDSSSTVKLLYSEAIKRPDYETIGDDILDFSRGEKTGEMVSSEGIKTYELNYMNAFGKYYSVNISLFRNNIENLLIERNAINDEGILRAFWTNSGEIETNGLEATFIYRPNELTNFEASILFQESEDKTVDEDASYSPNVIGYLKFYKKFKDKYMISVMGNYVGKMEPYFEYMEIFDDAGIPTGEYAGRSSQAVDSRFTLSAHLRIDDFIKEGMYLSIYGNNLLDKEYLYPTFSINNAWADLGTISEGRSIYIKLGYKF